MNRSLAIAFASVVLASASAAPAAPATVQKLTLPGAPATGGVTLDLIEADRAGHRIWVPAGNTGSVDVLDTKTGTFTQVTGFPTKEVEVRGTKRIVGPSSVSVSARHAFVGNRADSSVCAIDGVSLKKGACATLPATPDALAYIAPTQEVWATMPRAKSIAILRVSSEGVLQATGTIELDGEPEGYAVDNARGIFYTNLEDANRTLAIDVHARKVVAGWEPQCGEGGPKGIVVDPESKVLVVACPDHVVALDASQAGKRLGEANVGAGIDNIDYVAARHEVFVAAGGAATLAIFQLSAHGILEPVASAPTVQGARTAVADSDGTAYVIDPRGGGVLVVRR